MKELLIMCLLILTYHITNAQNIITGKITDNLTGEALPGATIYIPELKTGAVADNTGVYKIENLPKTKVIIQVSFMGYKSIVENVDLSATTPTPCALATRWAMPAT